MSDRMTGTHQLAGVSFWRALLGQLIGPRVIAAILLFQLVVQLANHGQWSDPGVWIPAAGLCLCVVGAVAFVLVSRARNPPPVLDLDAAELRIGSQTTQFAEVDEAFVFQIAIRRRDELYLRFGAHGRRHATVALRARRGALSESDREVLAAMVERSGIQLPAPRPDPYDPKGRFTWLDQQGWATKEQVLDAVLHTPASGDIRRG